MLAAELCVRDQEFVMKMKKPVREEDDRIGL
jgi:hypothetical protein